MKKILALMMFVSLSAFAGDGFVFVNEGTWGKGNEFAIEGYDPVAYFTEGKPVEGSSEFAFNYQGAEWHFKNAENLEKFQNNPQKYAPQYGGHCAWRLGFDGGKVYGDPELWTIVDDKLYLNYNKKVNKRWKENIPGFIEKGDGYWLNEHGYKTLN